MLQSKPPTVHSIASDTATSRGEMAERVKTFDWASTPLGPMEKWPEALRIAVGICLNSRFPMFVWWGPNLINIYNDAYIPVLGKRHPEALGRPARDTWNDIWDVVGPQADAVMTRGEATWNDRVLLVMERNGFSENTYFTWSYSPIPDGQNGIGGLFCACTEETRHVLGEREREALVRDLDHERSVLASVIELAPSFMTVLRGPDHVFELANTKYYDLIGQRDLVGKPVREAVPEAAGQGFFELLDDVYRDGKAFFGKEQSIRLLRDAAGPPDERFINFVYQPLRDAGGAISGIFVHGVDVTDLVRSREALRESEERFRAAFDQSVVGIALTTLDGVVVRANDAFCAMVGRTRDQVEGQTSRAYTHPDDVALNINTITRLKTRAQPSFVFDKRYIRTDGAIVHAQVSLSSIRNSDDEVISLIGIIQDETERRRIQASLDRLSEQRRLALNSAKMGWWHLDPATGEVSWDEQFKKIFGVTAERMEYARVIALIHPEDRTRVADAVAAATRPENAAPYDISYRVVQPDGSFRWVQAKGQAYYTGSGADRRYTSLVGTAVDVTESRAAEIALRESEERFRMLADSAPVLIWLAGVENDRFWFNRPWLEFTGRTMEQESRAGWVDGIHPDDFDRCVEISAGAFDRREPFQMDYRRRRHDGQYRWLLDHGIPRYGADGTFVGYIGSCTDITDRKHAEQERQAILDAERAARTEAERAGRMKDEFLATLSHELRTPMSAILGWSQILGRGTAKADTLAEGLRTIERNARAQTQIIEDLLDMSRIISGKVRLDVQRVDLATVARSAVESARPAADAKGIQLIAVLDPLIDVVVNGDMNRLQQVLWNLIGNAIKFTPRDGRIQVLLQRVHSHVEISVIDSGEGIGADFLPYVFDRFRQADGSTTRRHGGLGLGLSIVKQLVELHGGSIRAESDGIGLGATFVVSLPVAILHRGPSLVDEPRHPTARDTGASIPQAITQAYEAIGGTKILVVDDEPDARDLVRRLLEASDATVSTASSAQEAFARLLGGERFDLLVSDIGMPGEDGLSLIRRVRALGKDRGGDVPAIALTAYARAEDRVKAIVAGFQMHLSKPVEPAELIAMAASLTRRDDVS